MAIVDGLCYALGLPGIYVKLISVFVVNLASGLVACLAVRWLWRRWLSKSKPNGKWPRLTEQEFRCYRHQLLMVQLSLACVV